MAALTGAHASVPEVLGSLRGPWAIIFWEPRSQTLWFGRDVLGRRSLLAHFPDDTDPRFILTSVSELRDTARLASHLHDTAETAAGDPTVSPAVAAAAETVTWPTAALMDAEFGPAAGVPAAAPQQKHANRASRAGSGLPGPVAAGEEGEDAEPAGSDGYWTELQPGLYSIDFGRSADGQPPATAAAAAADTSGRTIPDTTAAAAPAAAAAAINPAGGNSAWAIRIGGLCVSMTRHAWTDPLLQELESYRRPETLVLASDGAHETGKSAGAGAAAVEGTASVAAAAPAAADAEGAGVGGREGRAMGATPAGEAGHGGGAGLQDGSPGLQYVGDSALTDGTAASGAAADGSVETGGEERGGGGDHDGVGANEGANGGWGGGLGPAHSIADPEEAVRALLNVLLAAVRVRCACIETRSSHPAAAYAAAVSAAAGATATGASHGLALAPQPSWRRTNPLDFSAPGYGAGSEPGVLASGTCAAATVRTPAGAAHTAPAVPAKMAATAGAAVPVMILFSGGVDSVLLAALAHRALPRDVPIDLSNVCFAGGTSPDREAARAALEELAAACPGRRWRLVEVDASLEDVDRHRPRLLGLLRPAGTVMDLNIGAALWLAVAGQGTVRLPAAQPDSAVTTAAVPLPPPPGNSSVEEHHQTSSPQALGPGPETSEAAAAAAAAETTAGQLYGSPARVVLLGHGADEQCGGYGRHRTRFRSGGAAALAAELEVDVRRLWLRNLGRDDRLVSDWGREARHPFLDEAVMALLLRLPLDCILDMSLPGGQGDKSILRSALRLLGLPQAAGRVKRAIQFGSRIGKVSNRRDFGSNRAANRQNAGGVALKEVGRAAAEAAATAWLKSKPS